MRYIIALDQGTTSSRAVIFDENANIIASHGIEFPQLYPMPGWVEHRPQDILDSQINSLKLAVAKSGIQVGDIADPPVGKDHRPPSVQRHCLAMPPYRAVGRAPEARWPGQYVARQHGPDPRRLFFRHQVAVDVGYDSECPRTCAQRRTVFWYR